MSGGWRCTTASGRTATRAPIAEGMSRGMAGMVLFIASEIMLFGGLFAGYFYVRNQADAWPPEGIEHELGKRHGRHA